MSSQPSPAPLLYLSTDAEPDWASCVTHYTQIGKPDKFYLALNDTFGPRVSEVVTNGSSMHEAHAYVEQLNAVRLQRHESPLPPVQLLVYQTNSSHPVHQGATTSIAAPSSPAAAAGSKPADDAGALSPDEASNRVYTMPENAGHDALRFGHVALGGTFDRLHQGHRLLLAATAVICSGLVYVGITADALLANKKGRELLQPYDQRCAAAVDYMKEVNPRLNVEHGPLTDPKAPTRAESDPAMEALVVSQETVPGALAINEGRAAQGFAPLTIVVVPLLGAGQKGGKLSSTQLRELEAQRRATAAQVPQAAAAH